MAIGRITGPLLNQNLTRDGVNLTLDNNLMQWDVGHRRVGILNLTPSFELDVAGTIRGVKLVIDSTATINLLHLWSNTTTNQSYLTTAVGPLTIQPGNSGTVTIIADTTAVSYTHLTLPTNREV